MSPQEMPRRAALRSAGMLDTGSWRPEAAFWLPIVQCSTVSLQREVCTVIVRLDKAKRLLHSRRRLAARVDKQHVRSCIADQPSGDPVAALLCKLPA